MNDDNSVLRHINRRAFLGRSCLGLGSLALASLLSRERLQGADDKVQKWTGVVNPLHHPPKVKRIIYLYMAGGPSHLETFDYKPKLAEMSSQAMPESFTKGQPNAPLQGQKRLTCLAPQKKFATCGKSGQQFAEVFPELGKVADEMCIV